MSEILDGRQDISFSLDEARVLQQIMVREEILRQMSAAVAGLEALNALAGKVLTGPVKLAVQWNKVLIAGWKKANGHLAKIADDATCKDINAMYIDSDPATPNYRFWSNLRATMGC